MAKFDRAAAEVVAAYLSGAHARSQVEPIRGPDELGEFPSTYGFNLLGTAGATPPVVPDTNILRGDVGRACRTSRRTVLVNAANQGAIRLLCPAHVVDEMTEHARRFSGELGVDAIHYEGVWHEQYLPLMRVVPPIAGTLTPSEERGVAILEQIDPDDVPAARLALTAGAFFLSDDGDALEAVYGGRNHVPRDDVGRRRWVESLKGYGDSQELSEALSGGAMLARAAAALGGAGVRAARTSPWLTPLAAVAIAAGVKRFLAMDPESKQQARRALGTVNASVLELVARQQSADAELAVLAPATPSRSELDLLTPHGRLLRACVYTLSRQGPATHSAREVSELLPFDLGRPRGESSVRAVLRQADAFTEPRRGRFQLGESRRKTGGAPTQGIG